MEAQQGHFAGVLDIDNYWNHFGLYGDKKPKDHYLINYKIELGLVQKRDNGRDQDQLRAQKSYLELIADFSGNNFGIKLGRDILPLEHKLYEIDPLFNTSAGLLGKDTNETVGTPFGRIGHRYTGEYIDRDLIQLFSKNKSLQFALTYYRNTTNLDQTTSSSDPNFAINTYEFFSNFPLAYKKYRIQFFFNLTKEDGQFLSNALSGHQESIGLNIKMQRLIFSFLLHNEDSGLEEDYQHLFSSISYVKNSLSTSLNYAKSILATNGVHNGTSEQISIGSKYKYNNDIEFWFIWRQVHINQAEPWLLGKTDNTSFYLINGVALNF